MKDPVEYVAEVFPDLENDWKMLTLWPECSGGVQMSVYFFCFVLLEYVYMFMGAGF